MVQTHDFLHHNLSFLTTVIGLFWSFDKYELKNNLQIKMQISDAIKANKNSEKCMSTMCSCNILISISDLFN